MKNSELESDFLVMVRQHEGIIYKVVSFYADANNVLDDLYQEVVLNLWKSFPGFRSECSPSTWVYRVALNTCISFFRKSSKKPMYVELSPDMHAYSEGNNPYINKLYGMIEKLGKLERALILLYLEDRPQKEIAEILGITPTNVSTKINRIKEKLKKMSNQ